MGGRRAPRLRRRGAVRPVPLPRHRLARDGALLVDHVPAEAHPVLGRVEPAARRPVLRPGRPRLDGHLQVHRPRDDVGLRAAVAHLPLARPLVHEQPRPRQVPARVPVEGQAGRSCIAPRHRRRGRHGEQGPRRQVGQRRRLHRLAHRHRALPRRRSRVGVRPAGGAAHAGRDGDGCRPDGSRRSIGAGQRRVAADEVRAERHRGRRHVLADRRPGALPRQDVRRDRDPGARLDGRRHQGASLHARVPDADLLIRRLGYGSRPAVGGRGHRRRPRGGRHLGVRSCEGLQVRQ